MLIIFPWSPLHGCGSKGCMLELPEAVLVTREAMMRFHDPVRIQGYCQACEKHGAFWSCPPFSSPALSLLPPWTHAVLVTQKLPVKAGTSREGLIEEFQDARVHFGAFMLHREARAEGLTALVAGHCAGCELCTRVEGKPCCKPSRMRYSLEAVGFDVTGLAEGLAGRKLHWPKSGLPEYLMTVGALLCPTGALAEALLAAEFVTKREAAPSLQE